MNRRQDVKSRTMKFAVLDPDIASKYDDLDDDDNALRYNRNRVFIFLLLFFFSNNLQYRIRDNVLDVVHSLYQGK